MAKKLVALFKFECSSVCVIAKMMSVCMIFMHLKFQKIYIIIGFRYLPSPPMLPQYHVHRKELVEEAKAKVFSSTFSQIEGCVVLAVTGALGFGKTTLAIDLCNHPDMKKKFSDGIIWIELGPQPKHPNVILNNLYCQMTEKTFEHIHNAKDKIINLTKTFRNILVIIDDVWEVADAQVLIQAFPYSKIIITTRVNNLAIAAMQELNVGPMTIEEAMHVMTDKIIQHSQLSKEDEAAINELANNAYHWPLLLSLIRGHLQCTLLDSKAYISPHDSIQSVLSNLKAKGLTAFDRKSSQRSRQQSVRACIEVSLNMLDKPTRNKLYSVILYTGIGGPLPMDILHCLWNVSNKDAHNIADKFDAFGLASRRSIQIPPFYGTHLLYLSIHAVISQFIVSSISSEQVVRLSPYINNLDKLVDAEAELVFSQYYGMKNINDFTKRERLMYNKQKLEHVILPGYVKDINQHVLHDPHLAILILENIQSILADADTFSLLKFNVQISDLLGECHKALPHGLTLSKEFNIQFQMYCSELNFDNLVRTLAKYLNTPFISSVIVNCIELTENIASCCDDALKADLIRKIKELKFLAIEYHTVSLEKLPQLQLYIELHSKITIALQNNDIDDVNTVYEYINSGKFEDDVDLVHINYAIKRQDLSSSDESKLFVMQLWYCCVIGIMAVCGQVKDSA